ncbi:unnamed protein product [Polarella glacialis]|uniref:Uncharacterized protein n=1 Tax=Polarella glacialis TaxID=89957 RepID=A0A813FJK2_POLGL|nr:unnamed protein product [Polarella glacialis]CAE8720951.1 unnamed protein product [Polarella glacialis]
MAAAEAAADGAAEGTNRRRKGQPGNKDGNEVFDELAVETKRTTLLDRVEGQLKGQPHVSRLLFGFGVSEDKKVQKAVDQGFLDWRNHQEGKAAALSGVLVFTAQGAVHLLEGPTELIFKALEFFHSISVEARPPAPEAEPGAPVASPREEKSQPKALVSGVRVLHFTELHGVRSSSTWCSVVHTGKVIGGSAQVVMEDGNCPDLVLVIYKKMLCLCLKVTRQAGNEEVDSVSMQKAVKTLIEELPTVDEIVAILNKAGLDFFFDFKEFEKVFVAPFQLVLHSELLWPMAPALSY